MDTEKKSDFINIEQVIRSKNPRLLKMLPGFALSYIKRIIHQDHINDFIRRHGDKKNFAFVDEIITEFGPNVTWEGLENIPSTGGCIVASNHPLGGIDGIALLQVMARRRSDIKFIVNDLLMNIKNFDEIFVGVNKHAKNTSETLDYIDSIYASDKVLLIFPAGLVSRKQEKGIIRDLVWKKSFVVKAKKYRRNIIPVHISGHNSSFFYNLARLRQKIGIKANIEMFYLMDEMYHQLGKNIHIRFGQPLSPDIFTNDFSEQEWAQKVKAHIYAMGSGSTEDLLPVIPSIG
jgi:putative hemolysin